MKSLTIKNNNGIEIDLLTMGASIKEIRVPTSDGKKKNIVLTHHDDETYKTNPGYFGCTVGRTSGRIKDSTFELNGKTYTIDAELNGHHGGRLGFSFQDFTVYEAKSDQVVFSYFSPDLESGYPGNLLVKVSYILTDDNQLLIDYYGFSDKDTLLNLTHHSYFNLGDKSKTILEHELQIDADSILEVDEMVPTGNKIDVTGSLYDFRSFRQVGSIYDYRAYSDEFRGLDDTWVNHKKTILRDPVSNRSISIESDYPAIVCYIFNYPEEQILEDKSTAFMHQAIAFECQNEPNGINTDTLTSSILKAGEVYKKQIKYTFEMGF